MKMFGSNFVVSAGAMLGLAISWLAILACAAWLVFQSAALSDQRARTQRLAVQNCVSQQVIREVVTAILFNQANLDPRLVQQLSRDLIDLPERCP